MEETADKHSLKSFLFFWSGQLVSILGSSVVFFCTQWWLVDTTESAIALSISSISYFVPFILASLIAGVVSDRYNRKIVILIVDSLQAFTTFIMIVFFVSGIMEYWHLFIFTAVRSVCQAFHHPTEAAIVPTMVPKDKLSRINSVNFLMTSTMYLVGPVIGATLLFFLTIQQALWIDIITYIVALIPLLIVKIPVIHKVIEGHKRESSWKDFKLGFKTLFAIPGLFALIAQAMIWNFLTRPISTLLAFYVRVIHNGTVIDFALISMFFNIGMFLGGIVTTVKKNWKHKVPVIISAAVTHGVAYSLYSFIPLGFFFLMMILTAIRGFTMPLINALYYTILQSKVSADKLGRITSIDNTLSFIIMPLGDILAGPLAETIEIGPLFFTCASLLILMEIGVYYFTKIRSLDIEKESGHS